VVEPVPPLGTVRVPKTPFAKLARIVALVATPLIVEVTRDEDVANESALLVMILLADATPLTVDVAMLPPVVKELLEMTLVVAATPFTVLVRTLPVTL
jgi:hypothetical protein